MPTLLCCSLCQAHRCLIYTPFHLKGLSGACHAKDVLHHEKLSSLQSSRHINGVHSTYTTDGMH